MHVSHKSMMKMICVHYTRSSILLANKEKSIEQSNRGNTMSTRKFSSKQLSNQEATLSPTASGNGHIVTESKKSSTPIQARHLLILGGLGAIGPLSNDMYLPSLPAVSHDLSATMS